jgi:polysaccharide pyruvyl transferase CsaB
MKKILVCGNYGIGNIGDEAILGGMIRIIESAVPKADIVVCSANKRQTAENFKVKAIDYYPSGIRSTFKFWLGGGFINYFRELKSADLFILGGGGLFTDEKPRAVWIWWLQAKIAKLFGKKLVCFGQSVGPLKTNFGKKFSGKVFKMAEKNIVRDGKSQKMLEEMGAKNAQTLTDLAFALAYDQDSFHNQSDFIVLSLRDWIKGDEEKIYQELAIFVEYIWAKYQLKTVFIPFQLEQDDDLKCFNKLSKYVDVNCPMEIYQGGHNVQSVIDFMARARFIVGMRLHSIILSIIVKRPFLALSYSSKVKDFLESVGMNAWIDYEEITADSLKTEFEKNYLDKNIPAQLEKIKMQKTYQVFEYEKVLQEVLQINKA